MYRSAWAAVIVLVAASAQAQDHPLRFVRAAGAGKSVTVSEQSSQSSAVVVRDADGKVLRDQKRAEGRDEAWSETVLMAGDPFPARFARKYEKAVRTRDGKPTPASHQGREITYEKREGKYVAEPDGGEPAIPAADLKELSLLMDSEARRDLRDVLVPKKAVREGETWSPAPADFAAAFAPDVQIDPETAKCEVKLVKFHLKDSMLFAVLDVQAKLPVTAVKNLRFDTPGVLDIKVTVDAAIDGKGAAGKMTTSWKLTGRAAAELMGKKVAVELNMERTSSSERSAEKGAPAAADKPAGK